ncbi:hypothetical protein XENTR_v10019643 [Xenopus tropicalis]|nr:hypothetical protein XENTR_v10019643 [Xenopus tropicalis]KAE8594435.1 hypothetical protein XENTR_v10019643 [Xenopus tropicalis]KAE8594436.1 hypothetical protein XENTR_v10019643 [Xenopus tropicalis]
MFYRTVYMLENGIKPVFVLEGPPPALKHRKGNSDGKSTPGHGRRDDLEKMLRYLGVPYIQATGEAEATCAALVKHCLAWGTVTEDMDALPFGSTRLIRNLKANNLGNVEEYNLPKLLKLLKLSPEQFVELCILLGCDYSGKIKGLGIKKALELMQKHGSIERILKTIKKDRIPADFRYQEAKQLFLQPSVVDVSRVQLNWRAPDEENLVQFLSHEKHLNETKIRTKLAKLRAIQQPKEKKTPKKRSAQSSLSDPNNQKQPKMTDFFMAKKKSQKQPQGNIQNTDPSGNIPSTSMGTGCGQSTR